MHLIVPVCVGYVCVPNPSVLAHMCQLHSGNSHTFNLGLPKKEEQRDVE